MELPLNGSRFEAMIPPIVSGPVFTIRRKASQVFTFDDYVRTGIMSPGQRDALEHAVSERRNILICGGTTSGKTTLTNAVIHQIVAVHPHHRLVIIEDTAECTAPNYVQLRATDTVDMRRLLKGTMRLRPDRIIVGEVRGGEALVVLPFMPAHAAAAGGSLPWDTPLQTLSNDIKGPVAFTIALLGLVATGAALLFGGEINEFIRRIIMVVMVISLLVFAANILSTLFATGAVV
jgi:type IV secretory pathway VirB2 component (pilin)